MILSLYLSLSPTHTLPALSNHTAQFTSSTPATSLASLSYRTLPSSCTPTMSSAPSTSPSPSLISTPVIFLPSLSLILDPWCLQYLPCLLPHPHLILPPHPALHQQFSILRPQKGSHSLLSQDFSTTLMNSLQKRKPKKNQMVHVFWPVLRLLP